MEELRFALLILGGCAIVAILAHGLWSLRKNNKPPEKPRVEPVQQRSDTEGFDEYGIGEVRVVSKNNDSGSEQAETISLSEREEPAFATIESSVNQVDELEPIANIDDDASALNIETTRDSKPEIESDDEPAATSVSGPDPEPEPAKLYGSVVSNPKPTVKTTKPNYSRDLKSESVIEGNNPIPEPPPFLLNTESNASEVTSVTKDDSEMVENTTPNDEVSSFSLDQPPEQTEDESLVSQTKRIVNRKRSRSMQRKRVEPSLGEDQMRIDFDTSHQSIEETVDSQTNSSSSDSESVKAPEQEVLVLNVRAPSEQEIQGAALLPMLLTLGFKFGDQDIFHRHVNSNGKGPVLFSLANMFKPGVFDIDNLENFTTQGISLFMILPIEGDPHQVFNMMHNAARKLAEEFSCQILDGRRSVLTKQGLQQYVEKIREFERQRIISRS